MGQFTKRHGHKPWNGSPSPTYYSWVGMKIRCLYKSSKSFKDYGARGITICNEWLTFDNFLKDMGVRPEGLYLERIDNNKGYYKENCTWATKSQQGINTRTRADSFKTSKYRGVGFRRGRWHARITLNCKLIYLGLFDTEDQAAEAYNQAAFKFHNVKTAPNEIGEQNGN